LKFGIYDPKRKDLIALCDIKNKFKQGRYYETNSEDQMIELNTIWIGNDKHKT
jgi:hypothetical protein